MYKESLSLCTHDQESMISQPSPFTNIALKYKNTLDERDAYAFEVV